jgi:hypothetical protein
MKQLLKRAVSLSVLAVFTLMMLAGCFTHEHIVGTGAATGYTESAKQWYLLWGGMALNNVDTKAMSGAAQNYKIITQSSVVDIIISGLTAGIISPRTVKVIK